MQPWTAAEYLTQLRQARPEYDGVLEILVTAGACARCCLRFAGLTQFGSDRNTLPHPFPCGTELLALLRPEGVTAVTPAPTGDTAESLEPLITAESEATKVCVVCTGILQAFEQGVQTPTQVLLKAAISKLDLQSDATPLESSSAEQIAGSLRDRGYEGRSYALELCIPAACAVRDVAMLRHLAKLGVQDFRQGLQKLVDLKDALRLMLTGPLTAATGLQHDKASPLRVCLVYMNPETAGDADFLTNKEYGRPRKRKKHSIPAALVGRAASAATWNLLEAVSEDAPLGNLSVPPPAPSSPPCLFLSVKRTSIYVGGWYNKLDRDISNSPFFLDNQRKGRTSVEEEIVRHLLPAFHCDGHKFMSAGREDMDVRMLGKGRPFALEVQNARKCTHSEPFFREVEAQLQQANTGVRARGLQMLEKSQLAAMKDGEQDKQKSYRALCWVPVEVTDEVIARLTSEQELVLKQTTPTRVAHRRALLDRQRSVYSMRCEKVPGQPQHCVLYLRTQAGTYIKEFVHGDEGRTQPNLSMLLEVSEPSKCCELDVEQIHMEWL